MFDPDIFGPDIFGPDAFDRLHAACAAICGTEHVRIAGGRLVVSPANDEEAAALLRVANDAGVSVEPGGGGTKAQSGEPPRAAVQVSTHRLTRLLDHTWQDMTCSVQSGCTWNALQASLARHGQHVALDPLWPDRATVGGIVAMNDSGSLRLRYGGLRDLVIGMTIVLADGTIARSGGKVVKNVAGYDLHKLMIGAQGTLGLVTSVNFRLHALPRHTSSLTIPSRNLQALGRLMMALAGSNLSLQAMQLRSDGSGFFLDSQLAALPSVLTLQAAALQVLAGSNQLASLPAVPEVWQARQRLSEDEGAILLKASMLPSAIAEVAAAIDAAGGRSVAQSTGLMTAALPVLSVDKMQPLRRIVEAGGGSLTVLRQPPELALDRWGTPPHALPLMQVIKRQFDPRGTLNPGCMPGCKPGGTR